MKDSVKQGIRPGPLCVPASGWTRRAGSRDNCPFCECPLSGILPFTRLRVCTDDVLSEPELLNEGSAKLSPYPKLSASPAFGLQRPVNLGHTQPRLMETLNHTHT